MVLGSRSSKLFAWSRTQIGAQSLLFGQLAGIVHAVRLC